MLVPELLALILPQRQRLLPSRREARRVFLPTGQVVAVEE